MEQYAVKNNENFFTIFPEGDISEGFTEISQEVYENRERYMWLDGELVINPNYEQEQAQREEERIDTLTMTALDFVTGLTKFGLTLEQINAYLEDNLLLKMQLTYCQNVYCGVVKPLCPLTVGGFTLTAQLVEAMFKYKNGELTDEELKDIIEGIDVNTTTDTDE